MKTLKMFRESDSDVLLIIPILERIEKVEGWLDRQEVALMVAVTAHVLRNCPGTELLIEVGSYCGRSTIVIGSVIRALAPNRKLWAIDPHAGDLGEEDKGVIKSQPTFEKFKLNIETSGLSDWVLPLRQFSYEVTPDRPISLLFIDGLHDYENVSRDFHHFEPWLSDGGYVLFHDYAEYYPGVVSFVNELIDSGGVRKVSQRRSLIAVQKVPENRRQECGSSTLEEVDSTVVL